MYTTSTCNSVCHKKIKSILNQRNQVQHKAVSFVISSCSFLTIFFSCRVGFHLFLPSIISVSGYFSFGFIFLNFLLQIYFFNILGTGMYVYMLLCVRACARAHVHVQTHTHTHWLLLKPVEI